MLILYDFNHFSEFAFIHAYQEAIFMPILWRSGEAQLL